ncbi:DUF2946 family protein [Prosthecomicrobium hirschii]|uniref:DUF2946 domain-containing protein n=1 Tax=Prosthecodimorpha hirschii TaxID=665126 RepID=A0A0P6VLM8_9HYPH|nr:DUF2946 family protein [Prosthecomicrobium hirschii]KPL53534.1 hypothetical protein ABB55_16030 [Prosthecomicrobium hirschii]MCW1842625.1 DUF2946 family protein [Prosthecomicrobium hirschii]
MTGARKTIARLLCVLALIVQIIAPTHAVAAMASAAADPLAGAIICAAASDPSDRTHPASAPDHRSEACLFCRLVNGDGFAPPPSIVAFVVPIATMRGAIWAKRDTPTIVSRLLEQIRGRAPPALS